MLRVWGVEGLRRLRGVELKKHFLEAPVGPVAGFRFSVSGSILSPKP